MHLKDIKLGVTSSGIQQVPFSLSVLLQKKHVRKTLPLWPTSHKVLKKEADLLIINKTLD